MDLIDTLSQISNRIPKIREMLQTEEATKNALIMPVIQALGYDIFNPTEVIPEFTADVGTKKNEKVDYVIVRDGKPAILIECKSAGTQLNINHASQLFRYFSTTEARFAILTNGLEYQFFSDIENPNKMDEKPFFEFSMEKIDAKTADELKKFGKSLYDEANILSNASELKYKKQIRSLFSQELSEPSEEFVKLFARRVFSGILNQQRLLQFKQLVGEAFREWISGRVNERLQNAIDGNTPPTTDLSPASVSASSTPANTPQPDITEKASNDGVVTTEEEVTAYQYIRAILAQDIDPERIVMRDAKSYCAILLDDNNRKPICRLYFSAKRQDVVLVDKARNEERVSLSKLTDIFKISDKLRMLVKTYDSPESTISL